MIDNERLAEVRSEIRNRLGAFTQEKPGSVDLHRRREWFTRAIADLQSLAGLYPETNELHGRMYSTASEIVAQVEALGSSRASDHEWYDYEATTVETVRAMLDEEEEAWKSVQAPGSDRPEEAA